MRLANYARFPDGFEFVHELANGELHPVILLSPPDLIAARRDDGTYYRRLRVEAEDGPAGYDMDWYLNEYLLVNHLPSWFMRPEHFAGLESSAEADVLEFAESFTTPNGTTPASPAYLELRYPVPLYATPQLQGPALYQFQNGAEVNCVARRFPAALSNARARAHDTPTTFGTVIIDPNGHIQVSRRYSRELRLIQLAIKDWKKESATKPRASYQLADADIISQTACSTRRSTRNINRQAIENLGGYLDLNQIPNGLGEFQWLDDQDRALGETLGFNEAAGGARAFVGAREAGAFAEMRVRDLPHTVYWPDQDLFNPVVQPAAPGHWEFFTTGEDGTAQALAWLNFGGNAAEGLAGVVRPTAVQIWGVRQRRLLAGREDITRDIELVWVPNLDGAGNLLRVVVEADETDDPDPVSSAEADDVQQDAAIDATAAADDTHDPTNAGANDQTGSTAPSYVTQTINGTNVTIDRAPARAGTAEPHKTWVCNAKGHWRQWERASTLDWNDSKAVTALNRWRFTALNRTFGPIRLDDRHSYSAEERGWLFEYVKAAEGGRPTIDMGQLAERFNKKFGQARVMTAMKDIIGRLMKEYAENDGQQIKAKGKRGVHTKKAAEHAAKEAKLAEKKETLRVILRVGQKLKDTSKEAKKGDDDEEEDRAANGPSDDDSDE
jgi:hypothetical protein